MTVNKVQNYSFKFQIFYALFMKMVIKLINETETL